MGRGDEPYFPNVSLIEDNSEILCLKSKPLSKLFIPNQYYINELDFLRNALEKERVRIGAGWRMVVNLETGMVEYSSSSTECIDSELLSYLRSVKAQTSGGDTFDIPSLDYYTDNVIVFETPNSIPGVGMGFYIHESTSTEEYGMYEMVAPIFG